MDRQGIESHSPGNRIKISAVVRANIGAIYSPRDWNVSFNRLPAMEIHVIRFPPSPFFNAREINAIKRRKLPFNSIDSLEIKNSIFTIFPSYTLQNSQSSNPHLILQLVLHPLLQLKTESTLNRPKSVKIKHLKSHNQTPRDTTTLKLWFSWGRAEVNSPRQFVSPEGQR